MIVEEANLVNTIGIEKMLVGRLFIDTEVEVRVFARLEHEIKAAQIFKVVHADNRVVIVWVQRPAVVLHQDYLRNHMT